MPENPVSFAQLRQQLITSLDRALPAFPSATSLSLCLDGHSGWVQLLANEDDDESFRCQMLEEFRGNSMELFQISAIENWMENNIPIQLVDSWHPAFWGMGLFTTMVKGLSRVGWPERYPEYEAIFKFLVQETKRHLRRPAMARRTPFQIIFSEVTVICREFPWRCPGGRSLPPRPSEEPPPSVLGFDPAPIKGLKVYQFGPAERKYCELSFLAHAFTSMKLDGGSLAATWPSARAAVYFPIHTRRRGDLAKPGFLYGATVLNPDSPHAATLRDWFGPETEFLGVSDEHGQRWEVANLRRLVSVVDGSCQNFERPEFDPEKVKLLGSRPFRLAEGPRSGVYFTEAEEEGPSFRQFCVQAGIRGIHFKLVWTGNREFLAAQLAEFARLVRERLTREYGSADIHPANIEFLYGRSVELWKLAKDAPTPDDLRGKEGYLCDEIPFGLASLRQMEAHGGGELSIYGPAV